MQRDINRFWNFFHHNSVISNDGEWKIHNLQTCYRCHTGNFNRAKNNLQRIWNLHDYLNKSVLAYGEWFYVNFKMADVWNWIPERSVCRLKKIYRLMPLLTPLKYRWTVPLRGPKKWQGWRHRSQVKYFNAVRCSACFSSIIFIIQKPKKLAVEFAGSRKCLWCVDVGE